MKEQILIINDYGAGSYYSGLAELEISRDSGCLAKTITSEVEKFNINQTAVLLNDLWDKTWDNTIIVSLIAPYGSNSLRLIRIAEDDRTLYTFDNGSLELLLDNTPDDYTLSVLEIRKNDNIFPDIKKIGNAIKTFESYSKKITKNDIVKEKIAKPKEKKGFIAGQMIFSDSFGNIISNIPNNYFDNSNQITLRDRYNIKTVGGDTPNDKYTPFAYKGSYGFIEIAMINSDAKKELAMRNDQEIKLVLNQD
ncbi:MAG: S-adenosyl-l-methionine hydroxide adenosyltransferase family protein [Candidatus Kapaibacteriales bacterium]